MKHCIGFLIITQAVVVVVDGFHPSCMPVGRISSMYKSIADDTGGEATADNPSQETKEAISLFQKECPNRKVSEEQLRSCFTELADVYGPGNALEMCNAMPIILSFDERNFAPSFDEYSAIFGADEAKGMVQRNPGLLAVKPALAAQADGSAMQLSYIVAATRPAGPFLLGGLFLLLSLPLVEGITGIPVQSGFFRSIGLID